MMQVRADIVARLVIAAAIESDVYARRSIRENLGADTISDAAVRRCLNVAGSLRRGDRVSEDLVLPLVVRDAVCMVGQSLRMNHDDIDDMIGMICAEVNP